MPGKAISLPTQVCSGKKNLKVVYDSPSSTTSFDHFLALIGVCY